MRTKALIAMGAALFLCGCDDDDPKTTCGDGLCIEAGVDAGVDLALDAAVDSTPDDAATPDKYTGDLVFFGDGQSAGWPAQMTPGISGGYLLSPMDGVALVDLDGLPGLEVVASSGSQVYAFTADGKLMPGWPATVNGTAQAPPSVADVDGDGKPEIVQAARGLKYSDTSNLHVIDHLGQEQTGWPKSYPNLIMNAATLADLDGDGAMEIIVQIGKWPPSGDLEVLKGDGTDFGTGWKHGLDSYPLAPAAVGDIDGDGKLEVGHLTLGNVTVRKADGTIRTGFPIAAESGYVNQGSLVFADLDPATPTLEMVWADAEDKSTGTVKARLWAADADGKALAGFPVTVSSQATDVVDLVVVDMDGDGKLEVVVPVRPNEVHVVSASGTVVGKTIMATMQMHASVKAVDVTGDGKLEILLDNNSTDKAGIGYLEGYRADGTPIPDFPLRPFGSTMADSGTLADLNGDGTLELALVTTSMMVQPPTSWTSLWNLGSSKVSKLDWGVYAFDARRSNCPRCAAASTP